MPRKPKISLADENINTLLLRITCLFWLFAKLIGWRMFTTYRLFPTIPIFEFLDHVPVFVHTGLFLLIVALIIALFISGTNRYFLTALLVADLLSCLLDQNRWHPWEYQYLFTIFIFVINRKQQQVIPVAISFMLAFTYVYSGLGKLNGSFLTSMWADTILKQFFKAPASFVNQHWVYISGYLLGLIELMAGVGLLFLKTRKPSAIILIMVHLFILLLLGPFGLKINKVVWPWNVAMILYLYILFIKGDKYAITFKSLNTGWNRLVILCWAILPALNFIGYWDAYLSSGVYSGRTPKMMVCVADTAQCRPLRRYLYKSKNPETCNGQMQINIQYWSISETNVLVYPELRAYKTLGEKLKKQYPLAGLSFVYY
jgi:hypothetical protein